MNNTIKETHLSCKGNPRGRPAGSCEVSLLLGARHLDATPTTTASQLRDLDAVDCPFEGAQHIATLDIASCLFQPLLSPPAAFLCTTSLDLLPLLCSVGHHPHDVITHLEEPP